MLRAVRQLNYAVGVNGQFAKAVVNIAVAKATASSSITLEAIIGLVGVALATNWAITATTV